MKTNKQLKQLLSEAWILEAELTHIIQGCFAEIFKEHADYAYSLFEEDLEDGREYNGCIQNLEYFKRQVEELSEKAKKCEDNSQ